jgi:HEAT repeats
MGVRNRMRRLLLGWLVLQVVASTTLAEASPASTRSSSDLNDLQARPATDPDDDRAVELGQLLARDSANEKTKLSAIAALARLGGRRAVKPLVTALSDTNPTVRSLAAAALGKISQKSALPWLRQAAADENAKVRVRIADAIRLITKANGLTQESVGSETTIGGFGRESRITAHNPDLYVVLKSCNDDSPGRNDKKTRAVHADVLRTAMMSALSAAPLVTAVATDAKRLSLLPRNVDASVVKMVLRSKEQSLEIEAELRLAISDDSGRMLSFLSGGAKVLVPRKGFNWSYLPQLRKTALENAVRGLFDKLIAHLRATIAA